MYVASTICHLQVIDGVAIARQNFWNWGPGENVLK